MLIGSSGSRFSFGAGIRQEPVRQAARKPARPSAASGLANGGAPRCLFEIRLALFGFDFYRRGCRCCNRTRAILCKRLARQYDFVFDTIHGRRGRGPVRRPTVLEAAPRVAVTLR